MDAARLARSLGARYFVLGDAMQISGRLYLGAAMYDATDGKPVDARIGVQGASAGFFELVDSLAFRLLVERQGQPAPQLERLASLTTSSLPALKLFIEGESFSRAGQYEAAAERYERATIADSTFALGYYRLAWARSWRHGRGLDQSTLELAARHGARLPERIRLTLAALQAVGHGDFERGVGMLIEVIERHPDDFDANLWLGDLLFHQNPSRGRSIAEARGPLERASVLAPARSAEALFHLIELAAHDGRMRDVDSLSTLFLALDHESDLAPDRPDDPRGRASRLVATRARTARAGRNEHTRCAARHQCRRFARDGTGEPRHDRESPRVAPHATRRQRAGGGALRPGTTGRNRRRLARGGFAVRSRRGGEVRGRDVREGALSLASVTRSAARDDARCDRRPSRAGDLHDVRSQVGRAVRGDARAAARRCRAGRHRTSASRRDCARTDVTSASSPSSCRRGGCSPSASPTRRWRCCSRLAAPCQSSPLRYLRGEVLEALHRPKEALAWYDVSEQDYGAEWYSAAVVRAHQRLDRR